MRSAFFRSASVRERRCLALVVLEQALVDLRVRGWCQGALVDGKGRLSLHGALATGQLAAEYARDVLRDVLREQSLPAWNDHPSRERREVLRALERALRICRDAASVHRGGWRVTPTSPTRSPGAAP